MDSGITERDRAAIAEKIRALGFPAPGSYSAYAKLRSVVVS